MVFGINSHSEREIAFGFNLCYFHPLPECITHAINPKYHTSCYTITYEHTHTQYIYNHLLYLLQQEWERVQTGRRPRLRYQSHSQVHRKPARNGSYHKNTDATTEQASNKSTFLIFLLTSSGLSNISIFDS